MRIDNVAKGKPWLGSWIAAGVALLSQVVNPLVSAGGEFIPHKARAAGQLISSTEQPPSADYPFGSIHNVAIGAGNGTHEGRFTELNDYTIGIKFIDAVPVLTIEGILTVTAANGDELVWAFSMTTPGLPVPPFEFAGEAVLMDGTGRFTGATGFSESTGTLFADGSYEYEGVGVISSVGSTRRP